MSATEQGLRFAAASKGGGTPSSQQKGTRDQDNTSQQYLQPAAQLVRSNGKERAAGVHLPGKVTDLDSSCEAPEPPSEGNRNRALNPTRFLCRSEVRSFLLEFARANRAHRFERVSEETLLAINEFVRQKLVDHVRRLPSKGKTI